MAQEKKLDFVKKVSPILYDIALALICFYIGFRARTWANMLLPFETGYVIALVLFGYYILNLLLVKRNLVGATRVLTYIIGSATFAVMYLFMTILTADVLQLLLGLFFEDKHFRKNVFLISGGVCLVIVTVCAVVGGRNTAKLVTVNHEVPLNKLKQNCRVVLLSDLHIGFFVSVRHIKKVVERVNALRPDLVVIAGDIINAGNTNECPELREVALELSKLTSAEGTFAVTGNHDPDAGENDFRRFLRKSGITLLEDRVYRGKAINIIGRRTCTKQRSTLGRLMEETDSGKPVLVLDHDPMGIKEAVAEKADVVMSGHTHKGQVFPLNLFVRFIYSKNQLWGMAQQGNTTSIVTAGTGYFSMPMRLGSHCEIVCVDMKVRKK